MRSLSGIRWRSPANWSSIPWWTSPSRCEPLPGAGLHEEVDDRLLEDPCTDARLDVVAAPVLEDHRIDALELEEVAERESGRTGADDADLRARAAHSSRVLLQDPLGDRERAVRRGHAAVDGALEQNLLDLVRRDPVAQRGAHVHRELVLASGRDERRDRDAAPRPAVEARSRPDLAPGVARDEVLEVGGELGRARDGPVDVLVPQHLSSRLHAVVAHAPPPSAPPAEPGSPELTPRAARCFALGACPYVEYCPARLTLASLARDAPES